MNIICDLSLFLFPAERCEGGELFVATPARTPGYNWRESHRICTNQSATLPLGSAWPQSPQGLRCYISRFQTLGTINLWSSDCDSDLTHCGRYSLVEQLPSLSTYEPNLDIQRIALFKRVVCLRGTLNISVYQKCLSIYQSQCSGVCLQIAPTMQLHLAIIICLY